MKYSGMGIQMGIIILVFTYAGRWLDSYAAFSKPYLTVLCALIGIFAALYTSLKDIIKSDK